MPTWFESSQEIGCDIEQVKHAIENPGELYVEIVRLMPGMKSVELVNQGKDSVTLRTNEGLMQRTNIAKHIEADRVVVELDERYEAGSKVAATSHFLDEFASSDTGVMHHLTISDVEAPGLLGFFYQRFGSSRTGSAFLRAYKVHFEQPNA